MQTISRRSFMKLAMILPSLATAAKYIKLENQIIHVEMEHKGCAAELYVNGIPIVKCNASEQPFISIPAHLELISGINNIEIIVNPGITPSKAREGNIQMDATGCYVKARLVRYPVDVYPGDSSGEVLIDFFLEFS